MANSLLKHFMLDELKQEQIVEIPGVETFKDDDGKVIPFKIKVLSFAQINKIRESYITRKVALDKKGKPIIGNNNELVYDINQNMGKALNRILVEALVFPNLKDQELMDYYEEVDITEMPRKVFRNAEDYRYVSDMVLKTLGLDDSEEETEAELEEVKN